MVAQSLPETNSNFLRGQRGLIFAGDREAAMFVFAGVREELA